MENRESADASKLLIDFLRDFTRLTEFQIVAIRSIMEKTVVDIMDSVTDMSAVADVKKFKANEILVKDTDTQDFVSRSHRDFEQREGQLLSDEGSGGARKDFLENKLMRTGGLFSKHMEALSGMDTDLRNLIAKIVGSVSADDVISQRLDHIIDSLQNLQIELSNILGDYKRNAKVDTMRVFRNRVLTVVYLSYSSEEEREIFHKIFGHPKEAKKAS